MLLPTGTNKQKLTPGYGFTLAELLIALAILGVIATFTIPKVLQAQQDSHKKAVFRETLAALSEITYRGLQTGQLTCNSVSGVCNVSWIRTQLNAIKTCDHAIGDGCWDATYGAQMPMGTNSGVILANGATIAGLDDTAWYDYAIDWNGTAGPNIQGEDQMRLMGCYTTTPCTTWGNTHPPGSVYAYWSFEDFFASVFQ